MIVKLSMSIPPIEKSDYFIYYMRGTEITGITKRYKNPETTYLKVLYET